MIRTILSLLALVLWVGAAHAQGPAEGAVLAARGGEVSYADWEPLAARAEEAIEAGRASDIVFEDIRADLSDWREVFQAAESANAARIGTIDRQLTALGPSQEGETEEADIAVRRSALETERARLSVPGTLAAEAFARADGLIGEIDALLRDRQAVALLERGTSPVLPAIWVETWQATTRGTRLIYGEVEQAFRTDSNRELLNRSLPSAMVLLVIALVALMRGRRWMARLEHLVASGDETRASRKVAAFVVSLGQIAIPFVGLLALSSALEATSLLGFRGGALVAAIPSAGLAVVLARWIAGQYFPDGGLDAPGLAARNPANRPVGRRLLVRLGWVVALGVIVGTFAEAIGANEAVGGALFFPVHLISAYLLLRLGVLLRRSAAEVAEEEEGAILYRAQLLGLLGRVVQAIALAGPLVSALGFHLLASALLSPTILTLAVLATVQILQRLVFQLFQLVAGDGGETADMLAPVLIAFALLLGALPVLALIWGVRSTDLAELWTSFREGFEIAGTRISPTDFLTFALVFAALYIVTRLVQGALRNTILPRTRLDTGGQTAVVSGVGYVGIFLAALIAITTAGIDLSGLAIVAGALSVGIGFGLQNIVSNFVSGIILLIERPIGEGDWIEVGGQMGYVRRISVRSTRIETFDRTDVIVPNADLVSGTVTNYTRGNSVGRLIVPVGVAYGTDTRRVSEVLQEIAEAHPMVLLNPGPSIVFAGFGADSLDFEIRAILRDVNWILSVKTEINHEIARRFEEEGFEIPFAQRDIWLRNPEALPGAPARPGSDPAPEQKPDTWPDADARDGSDEGDGDGEGEAT